MNIVDIPVPNALLLVLGGFTAKTNASPFVSWTMAAQRIQHRLLSVPQCILPRIEKATLLHETGKFTAALDVPPPNRTVLDGRASQFIKTHPIALRKAAGIPEMQAPVASASRGEISPGIKPPDLRSSVRNTTEAGENPPVPACP
ncbi:hypothetical protein AB4144_15515, partial [Rhizobiaceae sp. 2RAB30]